jgi:alcohol dehydrogenase class IV
VARVVRETLAIPEEVSVDEADTLIAVGGGTLIDAAKLRVRAQARPVRLIAIPSIWGSGAEASPIAIGREEGRKVVHMAEELVPDVRVVWPELGETVPPERARIACGDAWAHALEGFLSPLAKDELRRDLAAVIVNMLALPIGYDPRWFEASALACAGQARSSVGLVHGIAHTLEQEGAARWSHAGLCATWLLPVMELNLAQSDRMQALLDEYELPLSAIAPKLDELFDADAFTDQREALVTQWKTVLRDPSTRTNVVLVRPAHLQFFQDFDVRAPRASALR